MGQKRIKRYLNGNNSQVEMLESGIIFFARYWDSLSVKQQNYLKGITKNEFRSIQHLDTMQRDYYFNFRAEGKQHQEALSMAGKI